MFDSDMINYSFLMKDNYSIEDITENIIIFVILFYYFFIYLIKFKKCELMNLIWKIKIYFEKISINLSIKTDLDRIFSDIIVFHEQTLHYQIFNVKFF